MKLKVYFVLIVLLSFTKSFAGGTVVGNGGDPVFEFLESARNSMIETLKFIANNPQEQNIACNQNSLTAVEIKYCRDYFLTVIPDMLRLSQGNNKTAFVLRENPLLVTGPDGKAMIVSARTLLGPEGVIEFNRDVVKTMLPTQVLFLITHEFQHKSNFNGVFVNDNDSFGPFASGRDLIDSVSKYVVFVARRKGYVGSQFGIRNIFDCTASVGTASFGARLSSSRIFQSNDLMAYETSFGKNPTDGSVYLPETINTSYVLKFEIAEPNNCGEPDIRRKSVIQIVYRKKLQNGSFQDQVTSEIILQENPMCPNSNPHFEIGWQQIKFSCQYFGSEGTTSSPFSLSRLRH